MRRACCGFDCRDCPVYQAGNNGERLRELAERYSQPGKKLTAEQIRCAGCASTEKVSAFCAGCAIRACADRKGVEHCGLCHDYPCARIEKALPDGKSRQWLDKQKERRKGG